VLRKFSNDDVVYDAQRLGRAEVYYWPEDNGDWPDDVEEQEERPFDPVGSLGLLPFMVENQGVWVMAVRLDGSEDPPVVISFDDVTPSAVWQPQADRFSPGPPTVDGTQRHSRDGDRQRVLLEQWRGRWHATVWAADEAGLAALTADVNPTTD
jgi:hypothetical protein